MKKQIKEFAVGAAEGFTGGFLITGLLVWAFTKFTGFCNEKPENEKEDVKE